MIPNDERNGMTTRQRKELDCNGSYCLRLVIDAGKKCVVVEDLISTGKSSLEVVEVLRKTGVEVIGMVSIFNYGFSVAEAAFEQAGVPFNSLTNYPTLIELAIDKGIVTADQQETLNQWRTDPSNWGR